jgi:hypothetical protein
MRRGFLRLRGLTRRRRRSARSTITPRRKSARWRIVGVWNVSRRGNVSARAESACHFSQCPFLSPTEPAGRNAFYALEGEIHTGSSRRSRHDGMVRELRCSRARALFWAFCGAAWCVTVGAGLLALCAYATSPCDPGARSGRWPADSAIPLQRERPTLLLFLHPPVSVLAGKPGGAREGSGLGRRTGGSPRHCVQASGCAGELGTDWIVGSSGSHARRHRLD